MMEKPDGFKMSGPCQEVRQTNNNVLPPPGIGSSPHSHLPFKGKMEKDGWMEVDRDKNGDEIHKNI